jgi:hypothetical protein
MSFAAPRSAGCHDPPDTTGAGATGAAGAGVCTAGADWSPDDDWLGSDAACGFDAGPWSPRSPALASGGIAVGLDGAELCDARDCEAEALSVAARADPSVCPGVIADTSAATPAERVPAPTISQRRVRETRARAASRSSAARDGLRRRFSARDMVISVSTQHQASVRAA